MTATRKSIVDLAGVFGLTPDTTHILIPTDAQPARILATLERERVTHLSLPSALLWQICAEPAAAMTDLSELTQVVHVGPPPSESDLDIAIAVFGPILSHIPVTVLETAEILSLMTEAAEAQAAGVDGADVAEFVAAIEQAALASMHAALQRNDISAVVPEHRTLIRRWQHLLAEHGSPTADPVAAWDRAKAAWVPRLGTAGFIDYLRHNAEVLDDLMTGKQPATLLLFPEGRMDVADAVYRDTITARYLNAAVAEAVRCLSTNGQVRVLEVGAGTGATTDAVLRTGANVDYLFTDLSNFFLTAAKARYPKVRLGLFDIDETPAEQDYRPESFDVIIAAGVLNNARDADATVRGLVELLTPDGWLLITEPTREHYEILTSQAFMMTAAQDARLESGTTFLTPQQWFDILRGANAEHLLTLPADDHPLVELGQRLFVARKRAHHGAPASTSVDTETGW